MTRRTRFTAEFKRQALGKVAELRMTNVLVCKDPGEAAVVLATCHFDDLSQTATEFGDSVVEALYAFAATSASASREAATKIVEQMSRHVDEACPGGGDVRIRER